MASRPQPHTPGRPIMPSRTSGTPAVPVPTPEMLRLIENCFIGSDAVTWLAASRFCPSRTRDEAVSLGRLMLRAGIFHHVTDDHDFADKYQFYRFFVDEDTVYKQFWDVERRRSHARLGFAANAVAAREQLAACRSTSAAAAAPASIQKEALTVVRLLNTAPLLQNNEHSGGAAAPGPRAGVDDDNLGIRSAGTHSAGTHAPQHSALVAILIELASAWPSILGAQMVAAEACPSNWRFQPHVTCNSSLMRISVVDALHGTAHAMSLCRATIDSALSAIAAHIRIAADPTGRGLLLTEPDVPDASPAAHAGPGGQGAAPSYYRSPLLSFMPMMRRAMLGARPSHAARLSSPPAIPELDEVTIPVPPPSPLLAQYHKISSGAQNADSGMAPSPTTASPPVVTPRQLLALLSRLSTLRLQHTKLARQLLGHFRHIRQDFRRLATSAETGWTVSAGRSDDHCTVYRRDDDNLYPTFKTVTSIPAPPSIVLLHVLDNDLRATWDMGAAGVASIALISVGPLPSQARPPLPDAGVAMHAKGGLPSTRDSSGSTGRQTSRASQNTASTASTDAPSWAATGAPGNAPVFEHYFGKPPPSPQLKAATPRAQPRQTSLGTPLPPRGAQSLPASPAHRALTGASPGHSPVLSVMSSLSQFLGLSPKSALHAAAANAHAPLLGEGRHDGAAPRRDATVASLVAQRRDRLRLDEARSASSHARASSWSPPRGGRMRPLSTRAAQSGRQPPAVVPVISASGSNAPQSAAGADIAARDQDRLLANPSNRQSPAADLALPPALLPAARTESATTTTVLSSASTSSERPVPATFPASPTASQASNGGSRKHRSRGSVRYGFSRAGAVVASRPPTPANSSHDSSSRITSDSSGSGSAASRLVSDETQGGPSPASPYVASLQPERLASLAIPAGSGTRSTVSPASRQSPHPQLQLAPRYGRTGSRPSFSSIGGDQSPVAVATDTDSIARSDSGRSSVAGGRRSRAGSRNVVPHAGVEEDTLYEAASKLFDRVLGRPSTGAPERASPANTTALPTPTRARMPKHYKGIPSGAHFPRIQYRQIDMSPVSTLLAPRDAVVVQDVAAWPDGTLAVYEVSVQHRAVPPCSDSTRCEILIEGYLLEPYNPTADAVLGVGRTSVNDPANDVPGSPALSPAAAAATFTRVTRISQVHLKGQLPPWLGSSVIDMQTVAPVNALRAAVKEYCANVAGGSPRSSRSPPARVWSAVGRSPVARIPGKVPSLGRVSDMLLQRASSRVSLGRQHPRAADASAEPAGQASPTVPEHIVDMFEDSDEEDDRSIARVPSGAVTMAAAVAASHVETQLALSAAPSESAIRTTDSADAGTPGSPPLITREDSLFDDVPVDLSMLDVAAALSPAAAAALDASRTSLAKSSSNAHLANAVARALSPTSEQDRARISAVGLADFELLSVLGRGGYGKVMQVRRVRRAVPAPEGPAGGEPLRFLGPSPADENKIYAMKILRKKDLVARNQVKRTITERKILTAVKNPFIVGLKYAFQTRTKLYMVMEFVPGGDFFTMLSRDGAASEERAVLYIAEIVSALEALHDAGVVYRDLKPENVLLDADGHAKLTDFGLSRYTEHATNVSSAASASLLSSLAPARGDPAAARVAGMAAYTISHSFCGTEQYMAPEVLLQQGHTAAVDWWTLGVFASELMTGRHPFRGANHLATLRNIVNPAVEPATLRLMSPVAASFVAGLLVKNPAARLGSPGAGGVAALKAHPFFRARESPGGPVVRLDWDRLMRKEYVPLYRPGLNAANDVSNFDPVFTREAPVDSVASSISALAGAAMPGDELIGSALGAMRPPTISFSQFSFAATSVGAFDEAVLQAVGSAHSPVGRAASQSNMSEEYDYDLDGDSASGASADGEDEEMPPEDLQTRRIVSMAAPATPTRAGAPVHQDLPSTAVTQSGKPAHRSPPMPPSVLPAAIMPRAPGPSTPVQPLGGQPVNVAAAGPAFVAHIRPYAPAIGGAIHAPAAHTISAAPTGQTATQSDALGSLRIPSSLAVPPPPQQQQHAVPAASIPMPPRTVVMGAPPRPAVFLAPRGAAPMPGRPAGTLPFNGGFGDMSGFAALTGFSGVVGRPAMTGARKATTTSAPASLAPAAPLADGPPEAPRAQDRSPASA